MTRLRTHHAVNIGLTAILVGAVMNHPLLSVTIAQAVSANPVLQAIFRILLQPIVAIVHIAAWTYMSIGGGDTAAVAAFTIAAILAVAAYIATPTLALLALKRYKANRAKTKAPNFDDRASEPAFKS